MSIPTMAMCVRSATSTRRSWKVADGILARNGMPRTRHYTDWREMLQKEDVEAVIMAPPLWAHADLLPSVVSRRASTFCAKK